MKLSYSLQGNIAHDLSDLIFRLSSVQMEEKNVPTSYLQSALNSLSHISDVPEAFSFQLDQLMQN